MAEVNPVQGTGLNEKQAAEQISLLRNPQPAPEPSGQPAQEPAPEPEANQPSEAPARPRGEDGKFAKAEPTEGGEEAPEGDPEEGEAEAEATKEADAKDELGEDQLELADNVDGLAEQLGMEPDAFLEHLGLTVKVNGEERRVTLNELQRGYQMESDYRRKTADHADTVRAFDTERETVKAERSHYAQQLDGIIQQVVPILQAQEQSLMTMLDENSPNYDPVGYQREKAKLDVQKEQAGNAIRERQAIAQREDLDRQAKYVAEVKRNEQLLVEAVPAWGKDVAKGKAEILAIKDYVVGQGVPRERADKTTEAPLLLMARKAKAWDEFQADKAKIPAKKKVIVPKTVKPGAATSRKKPDSKVVVHRNNMKRLFKTHTRKDAAAAIGSLRAQNR